MTTVANPRGGGTARTEQPTDEPPAAAPATGNLRIRASGGWAQVYDGARLLGRTPLSVELPAGRYTLRILPYGEEPATTTTVTSNGSVPAMFEAFAPWSTFVEFTVRPIVPTEKSTPILEKAIAWRDSVR